MTTTAPSTVPTGQLERLSGQTHMVKARAAAPVVPAHLLATTPEGAPS
jgi:hypothetical protein